MRTTSEVKLLVNQLGRNFKDKSLQYRFIKDLGCNKIAGHRKVLIQNKYTNKKITVFLKNIIHGSNPFNKIGRGETILSLAKSVNKLGKSSKNKDEHYFFISLCKNPNYVGSLIKVESFKTKERKIIQLKKLKEGRQPFRQEINYREYKLQIKIYKELLKYKNKNIMIKKEYSIKNHGRIDFFLKNKITGQFIGIELKHDESYWQEKSLKKQIKKYHTFFSKIEGYKGTFLCSNEGKYGMHISKIEKLIQKII